MNWRNSLKASFFRFKQEDLDKLQSSTDAHSFRRLIVERYYKIEALLDMISPDTRSSDVSYETCVMLNLDRTSPLVEPSGSEEPEAASFEEISFITQFYEDGKLYVVSDSPLYPVITDDDFIIPCIQEEVQNLPWVLN